MIHAIVNNGVNEDLADEMRRQVKILNITSLITITVTIVIGIINTVQHNWLLVISNVIMLVFAFTVFSIKRLKYYHTTVAVLVCLYSAYFFFNAFLFHNSMQYGILLIMAFTIMAVDKDVVRMILLTFQSLLLIVFVYNQNRTAIVEAIPVSRQCVITACILIAFVCFLEYFKKRHISYRKNLSKINEQLKAGNKAKQRILSILSHDFNTPVRNLSSTLMLLNDNVLTQSQFNEISSKLQAQLQVLSSSMEDVLQWSKIQAGGMVEEAENVKVNQFLQEILLLFHHPLQEKSITIQNNIDESVTVYAVKNHLKPVFRNLVSNALKFSHTGGNIYFYSTFTGNAVSITVRDEGTGIKKELLDALQKETLNFTSSQGTAKEKGTGIGIMLVREFLQKSNGTLTINSEPGKGSTFSVILPAGID